jgi:exosortase D (VPLPA-CTERM-specific)
MIHGIFNRAWVFAAIALPVALAVSYREVIERLVAQWMNSEDYSHGFLIVPIALVLVWMKRAQLRETPFGSDWRGLSLVLASVGIYILGELGAELFTTRVSLLLLVIGLVWLLCGRPVVKVLKFPLGFLFLMLPLPGFVHKQVTFPLQLLSSKWSVSLLQGLGVSVYREGNIIDISGMRLQVVEACNGLRYILPLLTLVILIAFLGHRAVWKRAILILSAVPLAILGNILRIAGTAVVSEQWGREMAEGFLHDFSGWLVFMTSLGLFLIVSALLKRFPDPPPREERVQEAPEPHFGRRGVTWVAAVTAVLIVSAAPPVVAILGGVEPVKLQKSLSAFPPQLDGWVGTPATMDAEMWEKVGGQEYVILNYRKPNESPVNFYVAYYEYQRKAGDFVHSPRLCLPGAGWFIESSNARAVSRDAGGAGGGSAPLRLNELIISKDGVRQLAYFWYQGRGRNFTSEYAAKFYMVWDGIFRRRTDGALVRLVSPLDKDSDAGRERKALDAFALTVADRLGEYLP